MPLKNVGLFPDLPCSTLRVNYRESVVSMAHQRGNGGGRRVDRVLGRCGEFAEAVHCPTANNAA